MKKYSVVIDEHYDVTKPRTVEVDCDHIQVMDGLVKFIASANSKNPVEYPVLVVSVDNFVSAVEING